MIETFWRWKQVLTIRKWCLERKRRKRGRQMLEIYFNDICLVASGAKNALTLPGALHPSQGSQVGPVAPRYVPSRPRRKVREVAVEYHHPASITESQRSGVTTHGAKTDSMTASSRGSKAAQAVLSSESIHFPPSVLFCAQQLIVFKPTPRHM